MCDFSLVGLVGWGSIPLGIICLGGLSTFLGLSALSYYLALPNRQKNKEVHMKQADQTRHSKWVRIKKSLISTIWAIGTGMWPGALSG